MTSIRALAPARRAGRVPSPRPPRASCSSSCSSEAPNRQTNPPSSSWSDGIRGCDAVAGRRVVSLAALAAAALGSPRLALANVVGDDAGEPTGLDPAGARPRLRKCPATFNCVSTSSTGGAPEQFATAWTAPVKNLDEAIEAYKRALALNPADLAQVHHDLGSAYALAERLEESLPHFREAARLAPLLPPAHYKLGGMLVQQGEFDEGILAMIKAYELDPDLELYKLHLLSALLTAGRVTAAQLVHGHCGQECVFESMGEKDAKLFYVHI